MNKAVASFLWFLTLLLVQVFVLDPMLLGITYAPFIYVVLLLFLPNDWAKWAVLLTGFCIGLCVDFMFLSGGIHAAASLIVCYVRPLFIRATYKDTITPSELKLEHESFSSLFRYTMLAILTHHFFMFLLLGLGWNRLGWFLSAWLCNSILTIVSSALILILTRNLKS